MVARACFAGFLAAGAYCDEALSSEHGTYKTVNARLWPWLSGENCQNVSNVFSLRSVAGRLKVQLLEGGQEG